MSLTARCGLCLRCFFLNLGKGGRGLWGQPLQHSWHLLGPPSAGEGFSFKYSPGKLRGNQYKKMMTKEELEEEQR